MKTASSMKTRKLAGCLSWLVLVAMTVLALALRVEAQEQKPVERFAKLMEDSQQLSQTGEPEDPKQPLALGPSWSSETLSCVLPTTPLWQQAPMHSDLAGLWNPFQVNQIRFEPASVAEQVAVRGNDLLPDLPRLEKVGPYLPWAMSMIRQSRWDALTAEMANFGVDPQCLTPAAAAPKAVPSLDLTFGGELDCSWSPEVLQKALTYMNDMGFDCPIVPVRSLKGNWRQEYDAFFKAIQGRTSPMLGLCIRQMDLADLLAVPEMLRRYEGRFHSIIVNYDLTNGVIDVAAGSGPFQDAVDKVSSALALVNRACPSAYVWLAVGYHRTPDWQSWINAFDAKQYSGILLAGGSAVSACMYPASAAVVSKAFGEQVKNMPIGLIGLRVNWVDALLYRRDDQGLQQYQALRQALKKVGISPLHVSYTAGH